MIHHWINFTIWYTISRRLLQKVFCNFQQHFHFGKSLCTNNRSSSHLGESRYLHTFLPHLARGCSILMCHWRAFFQSCPTASCLLSWWGQCGRQQGQFCSPWSPSPVLLLPLTGHRALPWLRQQNVISSDTPSWVMRQWIDSNLCINLNKVPALLMTSVPGLHPRNRT